MRVNPDDQVRLSGLTHGMSSFGAMLIAGTGLEGKPRGNPVMGKAVGRTSS